MTPRQQAKLAMRKAAPPAYATLSAPSSVRPQLPTRTGQETRSPLVDVIAQMRSFTFGVDRIPGPDDPNSFQNLFVPCVYPLFQLKPSDSLEELVLSSVTSEMLPCDVDGQGCPRDNEGNFPADAAPIPFGNRYGRGAGILVTKNFPNVRFPTSADQIDGSYWQKLGPNDIPYPGFIYPQSAACGFWADVQENASISQMTESRFFAFPPGKLSDAFLTRPTIPKGFGPIGLRIAKGDTLSVLFVVHGGCFKGISSATAALYMHAVLTLDFASTSGSTEFASG